MIYMCLCVFKELYFNLQSLIYRHLYVRTRRGWAGVYVTAKLPSVAHVFTNNTKR